MEQGQFVLVLGKSRHSWSAGGHGLESESPSMSRDASHATARPAIRYAYAFSSVHLNEYLRADFR